MCAQNLKVLGLSRCLICAFNFGVLLSVTQKSLSAHDAEQQGCLTTMEDAQVYSFSEAFFSPNVCVCVYVYIFIVFIVSHIVWYGQYSLALRNRVPAQFTL